MSSLSGSGSWRRKNQSKPADSVPGDGQGSSGSSPKHIDQLTRILKMNLLRLEGEVDKVRTELGTLKGRAMTPQPGSKPETAWIPMLNAEIVVGEAEAYGAQTETNDTTNKKSLEEILDQIPAQALIHAGFSSQSEEESLARLERELIEFGKQLNEAVRWVRKMRGKADSAETPAFNDESGPGDPPLSDTVKMKWEEIARKIPIEKKPEIESGKKPDVDPGSDLPTSKISTPPIEAADDLSKQATVRGAPLPFVAKPRSRIKPLIAIALLLGASLAGGVAAYYAFADQPTRPEAVNPVDAKLAMVPLTGPADKPVEVEAPAPAPAAEAKPVAPQNETMVAEIPSEAEDPRLQRARDLGLGYIAKKEYKKAEGFLAPWVREVPEDPEIQYLYGRTLFYLGKLKQSAMHLEKATELDPGYAEAFFELGGVYMRLRWFKKAEAALTRFIQLRPEEPRAETVRNLIDRNLK